ncbi:MAG: sulfite exporter TauE/SafE family protein [Gammaproteobacteria bacterium]|nr:sulfite exporter TauE/SafE family protein [Gammaproteobacteria bacterium]
MPPLTDALWAFAAVALVAAYVQTVSGFALGLIVMGAVGAFELAPIPFAALVISMISLLNVGLALWGRWADVDRRLLLAAALGMAPAVLVGLVLLHWLESASTDGLRRLLGAFILVAGVLLMLRPQVRSRPSPAWRSTFWGALGGLFGGLFSTGGPPVVYHLYREPLTIPTIRATLMAFFALTTVSRIAGTGLAGQIDGTVLGWFAASAPATLLGTWAGRRFPPRLPDHAMRRLAFSLLALLGLGLLLS